MTRRVWPFPARTPLNEALEWSTHVFRAKAAEQRTALRKTPRRVLTMTHFFRDESANYARMLVRNAQGEGGFWVPDWPQDELLGAVAAGSGVSLPVDLTAVYYGSKALLWESERKWEAIDVNADSSGLVADVVRDYDQARIMPLWAGDAPDGLQVPRSGANINAGAIAFVLTDDTDLSLSTYDQYRGLDVVPDCPVIASTTFEEQVGFPLSRFDPAPSDATYLRARTDPDFTFQMRWHKFNRPDAYALRQWIYSRNGRQKAFWLPSYGNDLEVNAISGTTVTVYNDIITRPAGFHVELLSGSTPYYRQVVAVAAGPEVNNRPTADLTVDSALPISAADRCSYLHCARFDSDRIEFNHAAAAGVVVAVTCREVPEP